MRSVIAVRDDPDMRRFRLWEEVLLLTRDAVVIRPAMDHGQLIAPVAVHGRCVGGLPLQCRGAPGAIGVFQSMGSVMETRVTSLRARMAWDSRSTIWFRDHRSNVCTTTTSNSPLAASSRSCWNTGLFLMESTWADLPSSR